MTPRAFIVLLLATGCDALAASGALRPALLRHAPTLRASSIALQEAISGEEAIAPPAPATPAKTSSKSGKRVAVSGLSPQVSSSSEQQPYVSVPPPAAPPPPSFLQRAKAPFVGVTFGVVIALSAYQSKRARAQRQSAVLSEFSETMAFHLNDEKEMVSCLRDYRNLLGPGSHRGQMLTSFLKAVATNAAVGVSTVQNLKRAVALFGLPAAAEEKQLEAAANDLSGQPSVLGKLTFLCERAMPAAAASAKLRTKFPNWSLDTVTALQRAMLENLYRDLIADGSQPSSDDLAVLGLSEAEAKRLSEEVEAQKEAERLAAEEKAAEEARALELERMLEQAAMADSKIATRSTRSYEDDAPPPSSPSAPPSAPPPPPSSSSDEPPMAPFEPPQESRGEGTHEFECTDCGYIMFPAAGREFKFFGDDFKCPQCGSDKTAFVDNGVVDD